MRYRERTYKHRRGYFRLFSEKETAKYTYNTDMAFRMFVNEWNKDAPELLSWSLVDFYRAYKNGKSYQPTLSLA